MTDMLRDPEPFAEPVAERLGYLLRRASLVMMADLGATLAALELRPVEATLLILIGANPGCSQSELGRRLAIKSANMVPLIAGLVGKGLVERSPIDGRSTALGLTDSGAAMRDAAEAAMDAHEARFARLITPSDRAVVAGALQRIANSHPFTG